MARQAAGQPGEDLVAAVAALREPEEPEQGPAREPGREGIDGGPVVRDARRRQVLVGEAGVRLGRRVEDGDALERAAGTSGIDHHPHGSAYLLVGIRCRHHAGPAGVKDRRQRGAQGQRQPPRVVDPGHRSPDRGIGPGMPGRSRDHTELATSCHGAQQRGGVQRQPLREVDDDRAVQAGLPTLTSIQPLDGRGDEVLFVVELALEPGVGQIVEGHHVGGPSAPRAESPESSWRDVPHLPVSRHEGRLRRRVLGDRREDTGPLPQGGSQGGADHRR